MQSLFCDLNTKEANKKIVKFIKYKRYMSAIYATTYEAVKIFGIYKNDVVRLVYLFYLFILLWCQTDKNDVF